MARQPREMLKRALILCEGPTEEYYFAAIKDEPVRRLKTKGVVIPRVRNHMPRGLVDQAKEMIRECIQKEDDVYDHVWLVFDKDKHPEIPYAYEEVRKLNEKYNGKPTVEICFSAICFEYWLLLHFEQTQRPYSSKEQIVRYLKKIYPDCEDVGGHYEKLRDLRDTAIKNGEWAMRLNRTQLGGDGRPYELDSYTDVHLLLQYLMDFK